MRDGSSAPLVTCFKGCHRDQIIEALKGRGLWDASTSSRTRLEPAAVYRYRTVSGSHVIDKGRFEGVRDGERTKWFWWRKPGEERWGKVEGLDTATLPLYGAHRLSQRPAERVWFVEGEKSADVLVEHGLLSVSLCGGASQRRWGNALDPLVSRQVVLWPDHDDAGEKLMAAIHEVLPRATFVRPLLGEKEDAADYFARGGTVDGLLALVEEEWGRVTPHFTMAVGMRRPFIAA